MLTLNTILEELNDVPVDRLQDLYSYIHSLKANPKKSQASKKKILSYVGLFNGMSQRDYDDFLKEVKRTRTDLFDRDINL
ncbi:MAG: hypothetical protein ABI472_22630 [Ginsengibacter sp.]